MPAKYYIINVFIVTQFDTQISHPLAFFAHPEQTIGIAEKFGSRRLRDFIRLTQKRQKTPLQKTYDVGKTCDFDNTENVLFPLYSSRVDILFCLETVVK